MNWRIFFLLSMLAPVLLTACNKKEAESIEVIRPLLSVVVKPEPVNRQQFAGLVEPRIQAELGFRLLGRVIKRDANIGDIVSKGQLLAMLDPLVLELALRSAEAELSNTEAELRNALLNERRQFQLSEVNSASKAEYENALLVKESADAAVARAKANLTKAREQLGYTQLRAEFDGVITAVAAEVGQVLSAGETAFIEAQPDVRDVVIDVPEDDIADLAPGVLFDISLQLDPSIQALGSVREIAPQSDATTRTHRVKISLIDPASSFRLGTIVSAFASSKKEPQIILPQSALLQDGDMAQVWVVNPDSSTVARRSVTFKNMDNNAENVIILSGLQAGERVALAGVHSLQQGQQVRIDAEDAL